MTIYIVTDGDYSDYSIRGVFSTKEKAEHAKAFYNSRNDLEEYEVDSLPEHPEGMFWFGVQMTKEGEAIEVSRGTVMWENKERWAPYGDDRSVYFEMWARDEKRAIKTANERRIRLIESNQWTTNWNAWKEGRI